MRRFEAQIAERAEAVGIEAMRSANVNAAADKCRIRRDDVRKIVGAHHAKARADIRCVIAIDECAELCGRPALRSAADGHTGGSVVESFVASEQDARER